MSGILLRDAVPGDEASIVSFVRALAEYEHLTHQVQGTAEDFRRALFGASPRVWAMIAEREGGPVGFALWFYNFSTFRGRPGLYVEDVFVAPAHRGQGVGRALFHEMARRAVAEGCARMEWSVLDWNAPAIAFYRAIGAAGLDDWTVQRLEGETLQRFAE